MALESRCDPRSGAPGTRSLSPSAVGMIAGILLALAAPGGAATTEDCTFRPEDAAAARACVDAACDAAEPRASCEESLESHWTLIEPCAGQDHDCIDQVLLERTLRHRLEQRHAQELESLASGLAEVDSAAASEVQSLGNPLGNAWYACEYIYDNHWGKQATKFSLSQSGSGYQGTMFAEGVGFQYDSAVKFTPLAGGRWHLGVNNGAVQCTVQDLNADDELKITWCSNPLSWMYCAKMRFQLALNLISAGYPAAPCLQKSGFSKLLCYEGFVGDLIEGFRDQVEEATANHQELPPNLVPWFLWCSQNWFTRWLCATVISLDGIAHDIGYIPQEGRQCTQSADCPGFLWCQAGRCERTGIPGRGTPCSNDWDCPTNLTCRGGACNDRGGAGGTCDGDADCKSGMNCRMGTCQAM